MALPGSALAAVCRSVVDFADSQLVADQTPIHTVIGSPADAPLQDNENSHVVNFFFYRIEPSGDTLNGAPDRPWLVRVQCLVTAFAVMENQTSAGENDLRLLGEVLRIFHETPILPEVTVDGEQVRPRVIFQPLSLDELNHLWSTQGDIRLRPSAGYEVALVPVVPHRRALGSPLAGAIGIETRAVSAGRSAPFSSTAATPPVSRTAVDTEREDWAPRICLVEDDSCFESLTFALGSPGLATFVPRAWVAGRVGPSNQVTLRWEVWDTAAGWRPHDVDTPTAPTSVAIDPAAAATAVTEDLALPFDDQPGQMVLYAMRRYTRPSDGAELEVRSNPVLVSLFAAGGGP